MGLAADFVLIVVAGLLGGLLARALLPLLVGLMWWPASAWDRTRADPPSRRFTTSFPPCSRSLKAVWKCYGLLRCGRAEEEAGRVVDQLRQEMYRPNAI